MASDNWTQANAHVDATRVAQQATLICPACTAANAPGKTHIELSRTGLAVCNVCTHSWRVRDDV